MPLIPHRIWRRLWPSLVLPAAAFGQGGVPAPVGQTIQMAPYEVVEPRPPAGLGEKLQEMDHSFDGPFPQLRSGPLIEAILWRHRYLSEHPSDRAVILTTQEGAQIKSATTVYTENGGLYLSSNAMGVGRRLKGLSAADIADPKAMARVAATIRRVREGYLPAGVTRSDYLAAVDPVAGNIDLDGGPPVLGKLLVMAEETGDYSVLAMQAGSRQTQGTALLRMQMVQPFRRPANEVLSWTYRVLHDPARAGLLPVALSAVTMPDADGKPVSFQALVFDWEGVHYVYEPDRGTEGLPLPADPVIGRPYLCVRGGGLMECAYFCAAYLRLHPKEHVVVLPGDPAAIAYTANGAIGIFGLAKGPFMTRPLGADGVARILAHPASLLRLRDSLAAKVTQPIPGGLLGDTPDMQMRRVFLAFQEVGIPCHLHSGVDPTLRFSVFGADYLYGSDQSLRRTSGG